MARKSFQSEGREWGVGSVVVGSAFGAPQIFAPNRSETLQNKGLGASGLKIGAPQKRRFNDHGANRPILGPLIRGSRTEPFFANRT